MLMQSAPVIHSQTSGHLPLHGPNNYVLSLVAWRLSAGPPEWWSEVEWLQGGWHCVLFFFLHQPERGPSVRRGSTSLARRRGRG